MEGQYSMTIDLFEEKYQTLGRLIQTDVRAFITEDLWPLWQSYQHNGGHVSQLEEELLRLVKSVDEPSFNAQAFADEWGPILFTNHDLTTVNHCSNLLFSIFAAFEASEVLEWIGERYGWSKEQLLQQATESQIFNWVALWLNQHYANLMLFLLGKQTAKAYHLLKGLPVQQTIKYLPQFMLWDIRSCLVHKRCKLLVKGLAEGKNVRQTTACPIPFTKRMAHLFTNAPKTVNFDGAVWYGLVMGLDGNEAHLEAFSAYFRRWDQNFDLLKTVVVFFKDHEIEQPALHRLLSYLQHRWDEQGELCIKGWTLASLQRRAAQWHDHLRINRNILLKNQSWEGAPYLPFELEDGEVVYNIVQLTTAKQLYEEGAKMGHCVAYYGHRCFAEGVSIWSLRQTSNGYTKSLVTIEVSREGRIVQTKKAYNATPDTIHLQLIWKWARQEKLRLG